MSKGLNASLVVLASMAILSSCGQKYSIDSIGQTPTTTSAVSGGPVDANPDGVGPGVDKDGNPLGGTPAGGFPADPSGNGSTGSNNGDTPGGSNPGGSNPGGSTPGGSNPGSNPSNPGTEICEPFSDGTSTEVAANGPQINGKLYSGLPDLYDSSKKRIPIPSVNNFFARDAKGNDIYMQPATLFFSDLNAPERKFDKGFFNVDGANPLKNSAGDVLVENFGMSLGSNLKLADDEVEGDYELGTVSDDGSNFYMKYNGASFNILNDTEHPPALRCATSVVHLDKNSRLPFRLDYYQGPRDYIALVLAWRKIPSGAAASALADPMCMPNYYQLMTADQQKAYIMYEHIDSKGNAITEYSKFLSRGWKPLKPGNFELSKTAIQPPDKCKMVKK